VRPRLYRVANRTHSVTTRQACCVSSVRVFSGNIFLLGLISADFGASFVRISRENNWFISLCIVRYSHPFTKADNSFANLIRAPPNTKFNKNPFGVFSSCYTRTDKQANFCIFSFQKSPPKKITKWQSMCTLVTTTKTTTSISGKVCVSHTIALLLDNEYAIRSLPSQ
jgi:hypothetical protein